MPNSQGCSWNRSLVEAIAAAVAVETRAGGSDRGFSPEIQVRCVCKVYVCVVLKYRSMCVVQYVCVCSAV